MKNKKMTFDFNFWNIILAIFTSSIANILSNYITKKSLYGWLLFFVRALKNSLVLLLIFPNLSIFALTSSFCFL